MMFYQCITDFIFLSDEPRKADIIFVPGGNYPDSAKEAARLYQEGYAPYIMPSGRYSILDGKFNGPFETEWEYLKDVLQESHVPEEAILKEDTATYTYENAIASRKALEEMGMKVKTAIICCQAFHARRCLMYYQEQFPDVEFIICPVNTKGVYKETWQKQKETIDIVLGEMQRCGAQFYDIMYRHSREDEKE